MTAAQALVQGGIDAEHPLIYGLNSAVGFCLLALFMFAIGVILLPYQPNTLPPLPQLNIELQPKPNIAVQRMRFAVTASAPNRIHFSRTGTARACSARR